MLSLGETAMKFRYAHRRLNALVKHVEPINSSPVLNWPPAATEKPRLNQTLLLTGQLLKTSDRRIQ